MHAYRRASAHLALESVQPSVYVLDSILLHPRFEVPLQKAARRLTPWSRCGQPSNAGQASEKQFKRDAASEQPDDAESAVLLTVSAVIEAANESHSQNDSRDRQLAQEKRSHLQGLRRGR